MDVNTNPRRRWTETAIENELRTQTKEIGHFPARSELVARGLRGLWDAMRSSGGVDAWRQRLEEAQPVPTPETHVEWLQPSQEQDVDHQGHPPQAQLEERPPEPSHEEIAKLAYELYERGAPGGAVDHWLAAKQQLG